VAEVCIRGAAREFERILSLVANHHGIATAFPAATLRSNDAGTGSKQKHEGEDRFHGNLRVSKFIGIIATKEPAMKVPIATGRL
jgi:hypothetical protein